MSSKRAPGRSLDEWMELVIQCRQSGLTDAAWCNEHGISPSCFYNAVTRLRKKACQIPESANKASTLDLTSHKQDVVQSRKLLRQNWFQIKITVPCTLIIHIRLRSKPED